MPLTLKWELSTSEPLISQADPPAPGTDHLMWPPISSTLIYGTNEAVLVDVPITVDQASALADWIEQHERTLTAIYVTHGHGDHWFGASVITERFPEAQLLALPEVVAQMRFQSQPERLALWHQRFPGQIAEHLSVAQELRDPVIELEGEELHPIRLGHTDTESTTCLHVPSLGLIAAGDSVYNDIHLSLRDSTASTRANWIHALDELAALDPTTVIAGHKNPKRPNDPDQLAATREYLVQLEHVLATSETPIALFNEMVRLNPDRLYRGSLWATANAQIHAAPASRVRARTTRRHSGSRTMTWGRRGAVPQTNDHRTRPPRAPEPDAAGGGCPISPPDEMPGQGATSGTPSEGDFAQHPPVAIHLDPR